MNAGTRLAAGMIGARWSILAVLALARTAMGFQFQSVATTAPSLIADLQIGYAGVGTLIGLYMLPGIVVAFPGGLLSRRYGDKRVCLAGLALMIAGGLLLCLGHGIAAAWTGRIISGTGAVLFSLVLTKMTTDWFAGREIVLAMGVILASWPFGIAAALLLQPPLAAAAGWRAVSLAAAALCGVAMVMIAGGYRAPATTGAPGGGALPMLPPLRQMLPTLVAGLMWGCLNLALVLFFSFTPAALTRLGLPAVAAAAWTGAALWAVMFSVPLGGLAVQRLGRPDGAIVLFGLLGGACLALLPVGYGPRLLAVGFCIAVGPPAGAIMALPARVLSPDHRAGGFGAFMVCYYALLAFGPALAGALRDRWGTATPALLLAGLAMAATAPLLGLFTLLARRPG